MKETLRQYNSIREEIKELRREIARLEKQKPKHATDKVAGSDNQFPYAKKHFTITGIVENKNLIRKKEILIDRLKKCEELKLQIEEFISNIPDSLTRRVFQYRYIDNLNWQQIARRIGKYDESYPRKVIHDRYLEGLEGMEE